LELSSKFRIATGLMGSKHKTLGCFAMLSVTAS